MDKLVPLLVGGAIGFIALAISGAIAYRNYARVRASLISSVEQAEKELSEDIEHIGVGELQKTKAGIELLTMRLEHDQQLSEEQIRIIAERLEITTGYLDALISQREYLRRRIDTINKRLANSNISSAEEIQTEK